MVKFSKNWNGKLGCHIFVTIRRYTKDKELFYRQQLMRCQNIYVKKKLYCQARLLNLRTIKYSKIPFELLVLDTGIPSRAAIDELFDSFGINGDDKVIMLMFEKLVEVKK